MKARPIETDERCEALTNAVDRDGNSVRCRRRVLYRVTNGDESFDLCTLHATGQCLDWALSE